VLRLLLPDVREEEHRSLTRHAEDGVLDPKRALHEVDHFGDEEVTLPRRDADHDR
jgi:hypothetical protein